MPRGYRCIILATFGWLILTGQHPNPAAKHGQQQADSRVGDALTNIAATYVKQAKGAESPPESRPCERGSDHRDSDLCADWKAADAAADAAWWAAFSGWFGGFSFFGVLAAIGLTFHSNWIARDTAKRQLRPYLGIVGVWNNVEEKRFHFMITNFGQTPAYDVDVTTVAAVDTTGQDYPHPYGIINPGQELPGSGLLPDVSVSRTAAGQRKVKDARVEFSIQYGGGKKNGWIRTAEYRLTEDSSTEGIRTLLDLRGGTSHERACRNVRKRA